jgi:hypothetical protein
MDEREFIEGIEEKVSWVKINRGVVFRRFLAGDGHWMDAFGFTTISCLLFARQRPSLWADKKGTIFMTFMMRGFLGDDIPSKFISSKRSSTHITSHCSYLITNQFLKATRDLNPPSIEVSRQPQGAGPTIKFRKIRCRASS